MPRPKIMDFRVAVSLRRNLSCSFLGSRVLLEVFFDLVTLLHKQFEELLALFLHLFLVLVDEDGLHDDFVESAQVLDTASVHSILLDLLGGRFVLFLVWMKEGVVAGAVLRKVDRLVVSCVLADLLQVVWSCCDFLLANPLLLINLGMVLPLAKKASLDEAYSTSEHDCRKNDK